MERNRIRVNMLYSLHLKKKKKKKIKIKVDHSEMLITTYLGHTHTRNTTKTYPRYGGSMYARRHPKIVFYDILTLLHFHKV